MLCAGLPHDLCLPVPHASSVLLCHPSVRLPAVQLFQLSTTNQGLLRLTEHQLQTRRVCSMTHGKAAITPQTVCRQPVLALLQMPVLWLAAQSHYYALCSNRFVTRFQLLFEPNQNLVSVVSNISIEIFCDIV